MPVSRQYRCPRLIRRAVPIGLAALALPVVIAVGPARAEAQAEPAVPVDNTDQAAARAAARTFATAMGEPDVASVKSLFAGTPEDLVLVELSRKAMAASSRFKAATAKAFPDDAAKQKPTTDLTVAGMMANIDREEVAVAGDEAVVGRDGIKLKRADGRWRVTALVASPTAAANVSGLMAVMAATLDGGAADVEAGKFKSLAEAQSALRAKTRAALTGGRPPATRPARGPAGPAGPGKVPAGSGTAPAR